MDETGERYEVWGDLRKLKRAILKLASKVSAQGRRIQELEKGQAVPQGRVMKFADRQGGKR